MEQGERVERRVGDQVTTETEVRGPIPRYELVDWRTRFGVVAGITGRGEGPGFDLGLWGKNPVGEVMGRWRAFKASEPGFHGWVLGHQVHGTRVLSHAGTTGWVTMEGADGHVTNEAGVLLLVTVADCIPVYLIDPTRRVAGLLHSGWRGSSAGILARGLEVMVEQFDSSVDDIIMHCGIGICGNCYEVGSEVMDGCGRGREGAGPWHLDLREVLAEQATALGVRNISTSQFCSSHDRPRFFSHRGSGGQDGRMVAYLGWPSQASGAIDATGAPG